MSGVDIRVSIPKEELVFFEVFFEVSEIELMKDDENGMIEFVVDKADFELTMRRLYFVQVTKYNLEEWYRTLEELSQKNGDEMYTASTKILFLDDEEVKTIKKWSEIELSKVVGMPIRPSQKEQQKREEMEERINDILEENGVLEKDYFVRSSTRSPKDAVNVQRDQEFNSELDRINSKMNKLKVRNGFETFELITKSQR